MSLPYEPPRKWEPPRMKANPSPVHIKEVLWDIYTCTAVTRLFCEVFGVGTYQLHPSDEAILRGGAPE